MASSFCKKTNVRWSDNCTWPLYLKISQGFVANESKISLPVSSEARNPTAARDWFFSNVYVLFNAHGKSSLRSTSSLPLLRSKAFWLNKNYKNSAIYRYALRFQFPACLLLFAFSPFQGDLIRFFCALTKFEMQRAPSLRKPRSDVRLSARHLGTRFLWKDTKIRLKTVVGMHRNHLATCSLCLKVSTQNQFLQINLWFGGCCCCYCPTVV